MNRHGFAAVIAILLATGAPAGAGGQVVPAGFVDERMTGGLSQPVGLAFLPDGRLLFVEQAAARVRMLDSGTVSTLGTIPGVSTGGERGLLGIAVDPRWPASPYVYVHHTQTGTVRSVRIARYAVTGDLDGSGDRLLALDGASRYELVSDAPDNAGNHNGGTVRFGPDGMLYASLGEDAVPCAAQDTVSLRGVLLRMDVTRLPAGPGAATRALITPADNPFVTSPDSNARLVWAFGLRNPFRFAIDPETGDVAISDVGQDRWEELDLAEGGGRNFGWPLREGPVSYTTCPGRSSVGLTDPVFSYDRNSAGTSLAVAITAGVYRAPAAGAAAFGAEYEGNVFVSDYYSGYLWRLVRSGGGWVVAPEVPGQPYPHLWGLVPATVSDYVIGPEGGLWYCRQFASGGGATGEIRRIARPGTVPSPPPSPRTAIAAARPVPSAGTVWLSLSLERPSRLGVSVLDPRGRRVRLVLSEREWAAGPATMEWDGRDDRGWKAPPGLYFLRVTVDGVQHVRRAVLVR